MMRKILLVGGAGAIGKYVSSELLQMGHCVDVICLEEIHSDNERLRYYNNMASKEFLTDLLDAQHYDAIVDFLHYSNGESYQSNHELFARNTEHLIFLSSYRVYADLEHPIVETSPQLWDVITDPEFLAKEDYALAKSRCERFLYQDSRYHNWTIVRPVISFSTNRFDLMTYKGLEIIKRARAGKPVLLPAEGKDLTSSLAWAGNTAKMIANLLFKEETFQEAYTISSGTDHTWGDIAEIYEKLLGLKVIWVDKEIYLENATFNQGPDKWMLYYDRLYDRKIDNTKILKATGLKQEDFVSVEDALALELAKLPADLAEASDAFAYRDVLNEKMDQYLKTKGLL